MAVLALPLFTWAPAVDAQKATTGIQPLELALKAGGTTLPRFYLRDGRSIIGRVVGLKGETITIRRPSGGLRSLTIADIQTLEIAEPGGERVQGQLLVLADGTFGWETARPSSADQTVASAASDATKAEAGGPLIKLSPAEQRGAPVYEAAALDLGPNQAADPGPARTITIEPGPATATPLPATTDGAAEPPGAVRLKVSADAVSESEGFMYFRLKLSEPARQSIAVIYTVLNGSAIAVDDYKHRQGVVVFDPGQQETTLAIGIIDDDAEETTESFKLFVTGDPAAVVIDDRMAEAVIEDDDA